MLAHLGVGASAASASDPWRFQAHPEAWAIFTTTLLLYWVALTRLGPRLVAPGERVARPRQVAWFVAGVAVLWVCADWPVHDISERFLYSVHMAQHVAFVLVAPPLLLLGTPAWLTRWILSPRPLGAAARSLGRPLAAALVFNGVFALSHWPAVVNYTLEHDAMHFVAHLVLFASGLLMWFPVVNRLPEYPSLSYPGRMVYLFVQTILPTIPAAFLTFADSPIYQFYARVPRAFGISVLEDQQIAGVVMKIGEAALIWSVIVVMFFRWYAIAQREEEADRRSHDVLTWEDVERALERAGDAPREPVR